MESNQAGLDQHKFLRLKKLFQQTFKLPLQAVDLAGNPMELSGNQLEAPLCGLLQTNPAACALCQEEHKRALDLAFTFGDAYNFVCHAGLLVICTPLVDGQQHAGALFAGLTLPEDFGDSLAGEISQRLQRYELDEGALKTALAGHQHLPGRVLQQAATHLFQWAQEFLGLDMRALHERREQARQQAQIAETIQAIKQRVKTAEVPYPYEREKELIQKVRSGDRYGTAAMLNQILGTIMFRDPAGSALFKIRLVELLAVLSRAAAEAGVDLEKVLAGNLVNIKKILNTDDHTEICIIISRALNEFLDVTCARRTESASPLAAIVNYMEKNFDQRLSVAQLARLAHRSPSRAAHLFKQHYGLSLIEMLTRIRLEHAKKLLLDSNLSCLEIALRVGYYDQAYFTRTFTRREKVSPRRYRMLNRTPRP